MFTNEVPQVKVQAGDRLDILVKEAVALARLTKATVLFSFNGTVISVPAGLSAKKALANAMSRYQARLC